MTYCFDIDGTICTESLTGDYNHVSVNIDVVEEINNLFPENEIIVFTARPEKYKELTTKQLKSWGVLYSKLIFSQKPECDLLIDSKAINSFSWRKNINSQRKTIGFVASSFDLLHAGHCLMLKDAKVQCDHLIAALQSDPTIDRPEKNKPIQTLSERKIQLMSVKFVDEVQVYKTEYDLEILLKKIMPDVRILGSDYIGKDFTGKNLSHSVYYHKRGHEWSSSELRERIKNA